MEDRISSPGQQGRVLITPEDGGTPYYATVTMADNPTNPGTPLNKQNLLQDMVAALYSENNQAVPNDIFSDLAPLVQHWWKKEVANGYVEQLTQGSGSFNVADHEAGRTIQYARSINIDQNNGAVSLQNPTTIVITPANRSQVYNELRGSYVLGAESDPANIHKIDLDATGNVDYNGDDVTLWFYGQYTYSVSSTVESSVTTMVVSPNRNQYPDDGQQDGATYTYQGNFLLDGPGIHAEYGEYTGTGTGGVNNKTSITFSKVPRLVIIYGYEGSRMSALSSSDYNAGIWVYNSEFLTSTSATELSAQLNGTTLSYWGTYADYNDRLQFNRSGMIYQYIGFL